MPNRVRNRAGKSLASEIGVTSRRSSAGQVNSLWVGSAPPPAAIGGTGVVAVVVDGVLYNYTSFLSSSNLVVTSPGDFEFLLYGGAASGAAGNGYNAFGRGGAAGERLLSVIALTAGTYAMVIGAGAVAGVYSINPGSASTGAGLSAAGGVDSGSESGATNANGIVGTQVNTFIGGTSLFKGGGGGAADSGLGGSDIGGNGAGYGTAGTAAANTASGGGGAGGSGQPDLLPGTPGSGGSGIIYVRWKV